MKYWPLINSYYRDRNIAQQETDSFNQFIDEKLSQIVEENKLIVPKIEEVRIELADIEVEKPRIIEADGSPRTNFYPMEARIRNRTYSGPIFLSMRLLRRDVEQDMKRAYIGEMPIMLKSSMCWLSGKSEEELIEMGEDPKDFGGYFIINGSEKALMTQEVLASDRVLVSKQLQDKVIAEVISTKGAFKGRVRISRNVDGILSVTFPSSPRKLRLFVLLRALGLIADKEIIGAFMEEKEIQNDVMLNLELLEIKNQEEALDKIGKYVAPGQVIEYRLRRAQEVIDAFLLPHIGQRAEDRLAKAYYLAMMATKAIELAQGLRGEDDKDHYKNKRLELSGKLMEHLFRYSFKYFIKDLKFQIDRTITRRRKLNISTVVRPGAISERIRFAMSTGNWIGRATGVSKFMERVNYLAPLTDLRKVKSPLDKNRELYEARDVHGTHWGRLDPVETPDGPMCVAPDTEMLLDDFTALSIKDYENYWTNKKILSINWNENKKEVKSDVGRYLKLKPNKKVLEITTKETNRKIIATIDHPFYSENGKVNLDELKIGSKVVVLPIKPLPFEESKENVIVDEEEIKKNCPEKSNLKYVIEELKKRNLLPLKNNDERMLALSRLLGHVFGDGCLSLIMKKFKSNVCIVLSGTNGDLEEIGKEIKLLGFNVSKIDSRERISVLSDGRIIKGITSIRECYAKPLWVLLKALGAPVGDKALKETRVPEWIKKERKIIQKEFLSAYFGSEMTTPKTDKRNNKNFLQPSFSLNKCKELENSGIEFVEDVKELLRGFEINMSSIKIVDGIKRKNGIETRKIKALISSKYDNLLKLYGVIGFNYCSQRKSLARLAFEYLLTKETLIKKRAMLQKITLQLYSNGKTRAEIMNSLNYEIREHDLNNWIKSAKKEKNYVRVSEKDFPKFNEWMRENALSENGLVWETIESIKAVECNDVRDITTIQEQHNFIANGFLTGNCGLVKNLSLLAEVTVDQEEMPVEKILYDMGVKLKKL